MLSFTTNKIYMIKFFNLWPKILQTFHPFFSLITLFFFNHPLSQIIKIPLNCSDNISLLPMSTPSRDPLFVTFLYNVSPPLSGTSIDLDLPDVVMFLSPFWPYDWCRPSIPASTYLFSKYPYHGKLFMASSDFNSAWTFSNSVFI